jgi:cytochrome c peroxidase
MTPRAKKGLQVAAGLLVLALALPLSNLLVGSPSQTPLTVPAPQDPRTAQVARVLEQSCASCHVRGTPPPFYARLPLARGLIQRDIEDGLGAFDLGAGFATAATVPEPTLARIEREIVDGEMPPTKYVAMHWNARLGARTEAVLGWIDDMRAAQALPGVPETLRSAAIRPLPAALPHDRAKAALGERLYHDKRLSGDDTLSCASCHDLAKGGTDNEAVSAGIRQQKGGINAPTTFNAALAFVQFWDGRAATLEEQAGGPPLNPVEMGAGGWDEIVVKLNADKPLRKQFEAVYPEGFGQKSITEAIAEYERTLLTPNSPFDQYLTGNAAALSAREKHGYEVFRGTGCATCHVGELLGGKSFERIGRRADYFGARATPLTAADHGRYNVTKAEADRHSFKVPTLRNVAKTAPYFHDGSRKTLREAVDAMAAFQLGTRLADTDAEDVVAFLQTLTGEYRGKRL